MKLILISGKAEAGKTATANIIKDELENVGYRVLIISFATYLKFICKQYFGWNGIKDSEGRTILQHVGTDIVRKKNPDYWVKTIFDFVTTFENEFDFFIADDARFPNEIEYFKDRGFESILMTIRVYRLYYENSLTPTQRAHPSETALDKFKFDIFIPSESGLDNLKREIEAILFDSGFWNEHWER